VEKAIKDKERYEQQIAIYKKASAKDEEASAEDDD
jgi:hypothetical protein